VRYMVEGGGGVRGCLGGDATGDVLGAQSEPEALPSFSGRPPSITSLGVTPRYHHADVPFICACTECDSLAAGSSHVFDTQVKRKNGIPSPHIDAMELPSHFAVWLCSQEAKFLRGNFVWCNWDGMEW